MRASSSLLPIGSCSLVAWLAGAPFAVAQSPSAADSIVFGASWNSGPLRSAFRSDTAKRADSRPGSGAWTLSSEAVGNPAVSDLANRSLWRLDSDSSPAGRELSTLLNAQPGRRTGSLLAAAADLLQQLQAPGTKGDEPATLSLGFGANFDPNSPTPTSLQLQPQAAGQTIPLFIRNTGPALEVGGLDLKIGITGAASPKPAFTGVDLRAGTVFTTGNSVAAADSANSAQLQYWSVSINDPFTPPSLPGNGATTQIGTLTFSTAGVASGTWALELFSPETSLLSPFGDTLSLTLVSGSLQVVPEPGETLAVVGLALAGWVGFRRRSAAAAASN
jgi:hypothetical protein